MAAFRSVMSTADRTAPSKLPSASRSGIALASTVRARPCGDTSCNSRSRTLGSPQTSRANGWSSTRNDEPSAARAQGDIVEPDPDDLIAGDAEQVLLGAIGEQVAAVRPDSMSPSPRASMTSRSRWSAARRSVMSTPVKTMPSKLPAASRSAAALTEAIRTRPCGDTTWST